MSLLILVIPANKKQETFKRLYKVFSSSFAKNEWIKLMKKQQNFKDEHKTRREKVFPEKNYKQGNAKPKKWILENL
jgi:hypothetical protein